MFEAVRSAVAGDPAELRCELRVPDEGHRDIATWDEFGLLMIEQPLW